VTNSTDEEMSGAALSARDWRFLRRCRDLLASDLGAGPVEALLAEEPSGPWNGLVMDIRLDLQGVFGLYKSDYITLRLRPGLTSMKQRDLLDLLVKRIDAIKPGTFVLPPALCACVRTALDIGGRQIAVRQVFNKDWDYSIFVSLDQPAAYYVEILCGSIALHTKVAQLDAADGAALGASTPKETDRIIDRYR